MLDNFIRKYAPEGGSKFTYTTLVRHQGTIIAFAMDSRRRIFYSVLDLNAAAPDEPFDVDHWMDEPQKLEFPAEIAYVGYRIAGTLSIPAAAPDKPKKQWTPEDHFNSTTACLTTEPPYHVLPDGRNIYDAPFQVISDGRYVYVFRQSIPADDGRMLFTTKEPNVLTTKNGDKFDGQSLPIVNSNVLVDRFVFVGSAPAAEDQQQKHDQQDSIKSSLTLKREIRYRRSRKKVKAQSRKDSLGATDMDNQPFFEPTLALTMLTNVTPGWFSVNILPSAIADIRRWQFFIHNNKTGMIDSYNIEQRKDGLFDTKGTQFYTCPKHPDVFEHKPGLCPRCSTDLMPIISKKYFAESAIQFDGQNDYIEISDKTPYDLSAGFTVEAWINPAWIKGNGNEAAASGTIISHRMNKDNGFRIAIENGQICAYVLHNGTQMGKKSSANLSQGWHHISVCCGEQVFVMVDGSDDSASDTINFEAGAAARLHIACNSEQTDHYHGIIDEIRLWNRQCLPNEIAENMNRRLIGNEPGLVGYWRFDESSGKVVRDYTDTNSPGAIKGAEKWIQSDAPVGDNPGVQRTSFKIGGRSFASGISTVLYYQQEKARTGHEQEEKPLKKQARVMLAVATRSEDPADDPKNYIAALDFSISREAKLAQIPDNVQVPHLNTKDERDLLNQWMAEAERLENEIASLERETVLAAQPTAYTEYKKKLAIKSEELRNVHNKIKGRVADPLSLLHTDPFGLTLAGGILTFAYTIDTPHLFDSATGKLALYFRGVQDQFFVTYYDTLTTRPLYNIALDPEGAVTLSARYTGVEMDNIKISIQDGDPGFCTVAFENGKDGILEQWKNVSRDAEEFSQTINGISTEYDYTNVSIKGMCVRPISCSLLFSAYTNTSPGMVKNITLTNSDIPASGCRWVAESPGSALSFDGKKNFLAADGTDGIKAFAMEGHLTLETWVKPLTVNHTARLIHHHSGPSRYALGIGGPAMPPPPPQPPSNLRSVGAAAAAGSPAQPAASPKTQPPASPVPQYPVFKISASKATLSCLAVLGVIWQLFINNPTH
jgi:hypothetical protein